MLKVLWPDCEATVQRIRIGVIWCIKQKGVFLWPVVRHVRELADTAGWARDSSKAWPESAAGMD